MGGYGKRHLGKMNHNFHHGLFSGCNGWASHFLGPPSLFPLPSSFVKQKWNEPPTSLWKGEGQMQWVRVPNEMRRLYLSPHPSRDGRGSFPGGCVWLAANRGGKGEGSGGGGMGGR